ncbi:amidohydrolase family protein [Bacteroidota bacterium]
MKNHLKTKITGCLIGFLVVMNSCQKDNTYYSADDFGKVPKIDVHFHYFSMDARYMDYFNSVNFKVLSPNVDSGYPIDEQLRISHEIFQVHPETFAYLGTFSVEKFGQPDFASSTIERINECMEKGASGIKIWKNIGMELKDQNGRYVMADDPEFELVFKYLEINNIPLLAHLGEPRNCWLPEDEMTDPGDRSYYKNHPQYHMYLHPEMPSYEDQINARDNVLERYPNLVVIGAHLGSLEWNVNELAKRLDEFPMFKVDMSARIGHLKNQSVEDWDRVRNFMIRYQDRLLYGTDLAVGDESGQDFDSARERIHNRWMNHWMYLATDNTTDGVKGLMLPKAVIDKIYFTNADFFSVKSNRWEIKKFTESK